MIYGHIRVHAPIFQRPETKKGIYNADGSLTRSGLLKHVERLLETSVALGNQPKYLLMENVKGLVSKKFKPDFLKWLDKLEQLGYNNYWQVLNARDYGIPQNRERVFVVSIRKDVDVKGYIFPQKQKLQLKLKDMLENNVDEKYYLKEEQVKRFMQMGNTNPSGRGINGNVCTGDICSTLTTNKGEGLKIKEVSNKIRCGGGGSLDGKHTWDIVVEPLAYDEQNGYIRKDYESGLIQESRHNMTSMKPRNDGISNTLTTVQKDNYVIEPKIIQVAQIYPNSGNPQAGRIYDDKGISPAMDTCSGGNRMPKVLDGYRIRKLTPRECFRLMGVKDEQFDRLSGISNSQLYKLAGNSIVVNVLEAIFRNLFIETNIEKKGQLDLF